MNLYKTHIIHPHTHVPLIVYYNETEGFISFERDEAVLEAMYQVEKALVLDDKFQEGLRRVSNLCETQYPLDTLKSAQEFLRKIGTNERDVYFEPVHVH